MKTAAAIGIIFGVVLGAALWLWMAPGMETGDPSVPDSPVALRAPDSGDRQSDVPVNPTSGLHVDEIAVSIAGSRGEAARHEHEHAEVEDPTGDLRLYERLPMSPIPHHVIRGWGARGAGQIPGFVGAYVIVDPRISDDELADLARDIRDYHHDADALSVRILDSEHAASYDRHDDGGALAAAHLVGHVNRNRSLGTDSIEVRGRVVDMP